MEFLKLEHFLREILYFWGKRYYYVKTTEVINLINHDELMLAC